MTSPPTNADRLSVALKRAGMLAESVDLAPKSAHEALTRSLVDDLADEVQSLRAQVDRLFWTLLGAVSVQLVLQLGGWL